MATLTIDKVEAAKDHDRRVLRFEARESLMAVELAVKNDPRAREWLKRNRHLWR